VAINTINKVVSTVFNPLIIRKHNGMSDFKTKIRNFRKRVWNWSSFLPHILFNVRFPNIMLLLAGAIWSAVRGQ
jgi:hypothetical protein